MSLDRRTWVSPPPALAERDPTIKFLVEQRRAAYETVLEANEILKHIMGNIDPKKTVMPTEPLTKLQSHTLDWIVSFYIDNGFSPTNRELCDGMSWPSANSGDVAIRALVKKGYLVKSSHKWRGIIPIFNSRRRKIKITGQNTKQ